MSAVQSVEVLARTTLPTPYGPFTVLAFTTGESKTAHLALAMGTTHSTNVYVRVHSECLTGDVFGSLKCDCGEQLNDSLRQIAEVGSGVLIYLRGHEGRGIGLVEKLRAYALQQDQGMDTVEANLALGHPADGRDYQPAAAILRHLGVREVVLFTNNNDKAEALMDSGIQVRTVAMRSTVTQHNERYLRTKAERLGHIGVWSPATVPDIA